MKRNKPRKRPYKSNRKPKQILDGQLLEVPVKKVGAKRVVKWPNLISDIGMIMIKEGAKIGSVVKRKEVKVLPNR